MHRISLEAANLTSSLDSIQWIAVFSLIELFKLGFECSDYLSKFFDVLFEVSSFLV